MSLPDIPDLNPPNDSDIDSSIAITDKMWYKLYYEHHYWTLWYDAIYSGLYDIDDQSLYEEVAELFSSFAIEVEFLAKPNGGVCMRNYSWSLLGGFCLFRDSSDYIDTYRLKVYDFVRVFDVIDYPDDFD